MNRVKKTGLVRLYELKRGEKYYDLDGIVREFIDCVFDESNPDFIKICTRKLRHFCPEDQHMHGPNVANMEYYYYTGRREKNSFIAGFKRAMTLCTKHMGKFDLENAELDNPCNIHLTMQKEYKRWLKNSDVL